MSNHTRAPSDGGSRDVEANDPIQLETTTGLGQEKAAGANDIPAHSSGLSPSNEAATTAPSGFPPLRQTVTSRSARQAAETLENFAKSPSNPRNWSNGKKWRVTMTVAVTGFVSTLGSSIGVPGIHAIKDEFGFNNDKIGILITSIYVLGLGSGPFLYAPISELWGRQVAYLSSLIPLVGFSLGTALAPNMQTLLALRFFCGVCGSSGPALGVATVADMFSPQERGRPISVYAVGPMAGPVLGSMIGYWLLLSGWRWLFWTVTILSIVNLSLFVFFTQETYAPAIEKVLRYQLRHPLSEPTTFAQRISPLRILHDLGWMRAMVSASDAKEVFSKAFSRPPRLLLGNPVCFIFSAYYAYIYGIIYLFVVSVPLLFGAPPFARHNLFSYQWSNSTLSLGYLGLAIGFCCAATTAAKAQDRIYKYMCKRSGAEKGQPEYRLVLAQIGMIIMPIGLFIFGWTAQAQTHWIGPQIGMVLIAFGLMLPFNSIQTFIVDAFFPYSAAGIAAATALRSIVACILPEFSADMFGDLGWGWAGTLLALLAALGIPAPVIMFIYGERLRERFKFEG